MEKEKIGWRVHTQYSTKNPKVLIMKKMYVKLECRACGLYQETQEHKLECENLFKTEDNHNYIIII